MVSLAEKDRPEKAIVVIMTDGEENSSTEMTTASARAAAKADEVKQRTGGNR